MQDKLLGGGWAFFHPTLQSWATDVVPQARATAVSLFAVSLFAASLFVGSAVGTALVACWPMRTRSRRSSRSRS